MKRPRSVAQKHPSDDNASDKEQHARNGQEKQDEKRFERKRRSGHGGTKRAASQARATDQERQLEARPPRNTPPKRKNAGKRQLRSTL